MNEPVRHPIHRMPFWVGHTVNDAAHPHHVVREGGADLWVVEYTPAGRGWLRLSDGRYEPLRPGDFFAYRPEVPQDYGMDVAHGCWEHYWLIFMPRADWYDWLKWPEAEPGVMRLSLPGSDLRRRMKRLLAEILDMSNRPLHRRDEFLMNLIERVLLLCDTVNPRQAHAAMDSRVQQALDYLCRHYAEPVSVAALARACSLSESRLAHLFRAETGQTPMQFLEKHRIERARALLAATPEPISRIGLAVGFPNPLYFSRVFRKHAGCSPRAFRRRLTTAKPFS